MRADGGSKCVVLCKHWPNLFPLLFYFFIRLGSGTQKQVKMLQVEHES